MRPSSSSSGQGLSAKVKARLDRGKGGRDLAGSTSAKVPAATAASAGSASAKVPAAAGGSAAAADQAAARSAAASAAAARTAAAGASAAATQPQQHVPSPHATRPPQQRLTRELSIASHNTLDTLEKIETEVVSMQQTCEEAELTLASTAADALDPALRNQLAQLHGNANKLLATRIDAILTSELISGRDDARAKRKALIKAVEKLIETVEAQVKLFDKLRAQSH